MTQFTAKYEQNGTITAGPFEDGNVYSGITEASRFWTVIQDKIKDEGFVVAPYVAPAVDLNAYLAQKRWEKEVGGFEFNGFSIATDDRSQLKIAGARIKADSDSNFITPWKLPDGTFIEIPAPTIIAISNAVLDHIHECFTLESEISAKISAGTITTTAQIDAELEG